GPATQASAKKSKRYGIEATLISYDKERQVVRAKVMSNKVRGFGGSNAGGRAPKDVQVRKEMDFAVKPDGSVLTRTVIKAVSGAGLDNSGTQEGFERAIGAVPRDKPVVFSIERNAAAKSDPSAPAFRLKTLIIRLSEEELLRRFEEMTEEVN
ncbi:MAG: hypothetical protein MJE66_21485, partial [Proteobacteria bacterium]|nr:hypothetical protein [Pseudomonadota bacterium]